MQIVRRLLQIDLPPGRSAFLWGPRKVGKTHWLHGHFLTGDDHLIDLLETDTFADYAARAALLRERWDGRRITWPWRVVLDQLWSGDLLGRPVCRDRRETQ